VPLSLAGTCAAMWLAGFSIDNLSLRRWRQIGLVVDDAIVMIENMFRYMEAAPRRCGRGNEGRQTYRFTVVSISVFAHRRVHPLCSWAALSDGCSANSP